MLFKKLQRSNPSARAASPSSKRQHIQNDSIWHVSCRNFSSALRALLQAHNTRRAEDVSARPDLYRLLPEAQTHRAFQIALRSLEPSAHLSLFVHFVLVERKKKPRWFCRSTTSRKTKVLKAKGLVKTHNSVQHTTRTQDNRGHHTNRLSLLTRSISFSISIL